MGVITECLMVLLLCQAIGFMRADDTQVDQPVQPGVGAGIGEGEGEQIFEDEAAADMRALEEEFTDEEMAALQLLENVDKRGKKKGGCSKPSTKATADLKKFNKLLLEWHNYYRCLHGVKKLGYSTTLEQGSKRNVDMNIRQGGMDHTQGNSYGENLFAAWSSGGMKQTSAQKVVKAWYDEISMYNFNNPGFGYNTGHFTQVVWKNTKKVGCYAREIPDQRMKKVFVACQYDPAGNMDVWGPPAKNTKNWKDQVPRPK